MPRVCHRTIDEMSIEEFARAIICVFQELPVTGPADDDLATDDDESEDDEE